MIRKDEPAVRLPSAFLFLAAFALVLLGLNPTFYANDSPETVTACATLGVPHPPGYPLHTLLGRLFAVLPLGPPTFRVNLLSAFLGASVCALLFFLLTRRLQVPRGLAAAVSFLWITGASAYPAALSAKTGIYELTAVFLMWILAALWGGRAPFAFFLLGLSFANHWMSMLAFLPGLAFLWYFETKKKERPERFPSQEGVAPETTPPLDPGMKAEGSGPGPGWEKWIPSGRAVVLLSLAVLGLSTYLYLPLRAAHHPDLNWGEPSSLGNFLFNFFRSQYNPAEATGDPGNWFLQWGAFLKGAFLEHPGLLPVALAGFVVAYRREPLRAFGLALLWLSLLLALGVYLDLKEEHLYLIRDYALPSHALLLTFTAWGIQILLGDRGPRGTGSSIRIAAVLLALFATFLAVHRLGRDRQTHYTYVHDLVLNGYKGLPRGALYYCKGDGVVFPSWYFQWVGGLRPDLAVVGVDGLPMEWVRRGLASRHPDLKIPFPEQALGAESIKPLMEWVARSNTHRPLYLSYYIPPEDPTGRIAGIPYGVTVQAALPERAPTFDEARSDRLWDTMRMRGMKDGVFAVDRNTRDFAVGDYAVFRNALGVLYEDLADAARARVQKGGGAENYFQAGAYTARSYGHFAWAEKWAPDVPEHPYNMGNALFHMGRKREAMACYERAVELKPRYAEALFNWGVAAYDLGEFQTAGWLFDRTLAVDPDHAEAKHGRDYLLQQGRYFRSRNPAGPNDR